MIKTGDIFPIVDKGKETTANILGVYVYEENIYMPVIIDATNEFKVFHILPHGLKVAGRGITEELSKIVFVPEEQTRIRDILLEGVDVTSE
jgi:hypothetical protein